MRTFPIIALALMLWAGVATSTGCHDEEDNGGNSGTPDTSSSEDTGSVTEDSTTDTPSTFDDIVTDDTSTPVDDVAVSTDVEAPDTTTDTGEPVNDVSSGLESFRVATFNAGLAVNFVSYANERVPAIISAINDITDVDVICLQEVWLPDHITALVDGTESVYPHSYHFVTKEEGGGEPSCTVEEALPLKECVETNCAAAVNLSECAITNCGAQFAAVSPTCQGCLAANLTKTIPEIFAACAEGSSSLAYEGHNGLLLLSRLPLSATEHTALPSTLVQRSALYAKVDGTLDVVCTHLAANLSEPPYNGPFGSYEGEQKKQIEDLNAWITTKANKNAVLLGDLNTGPNVGETIVEELPANWQFILGLGWKDPYLEQDEPACTWCDTNNLVSSGNHILDHALVQDLPAKDPQRILDQTVTIGVEGSGDVDTKLSDHYGIAISVEVEK
ncbi:MAG: endonuclease/exonuclease/phosphatase family protein [Myxococcales bacterium]|nr:endonuclease/exonuclease/phosphatase family protein [Myxococcales bacterium]